MKFKPGDVLALTHDEERCKSGDLVILLYYNDVPDYVCGHKLYVRYLNGVYKDKLSNGYTWYDKDFMLVSSNAVPQVTDLIDI